MKQQLLVMVGSMVVLLGCGGGKPPAEAPTQGDESVTETGAESPAAESPAEESTPEAAEPESEDPAPEASAPPPAAKKESNTEEVKEASEARITDKNIVISGKIQFETGKAKLKKVSFEILDEVVFAMQRHPEIVRLQVVGHTDSDGDAKANKRLSKQRATAVMSYLIRNGIAKDRLSSLGEGEDVPIASNDTEEGKEKNRRVEFVIVERVPIRATTHTTTTAGGGKTTDRNATNDETEELIKKRGLDKKF